MTRDEIVLKAIENLQAVQSGKTLEWEKGGRWCDVTNGFNAADNIAFLAKCRIKPEPVLRKWTEAEIEAECIKGTVLKLVAKGSKNIGPISVTGVAIYVGRIEVGVHEKAAEVLHRDYVIAATGAPCGVLE